MIKIKNGDIFSKIHGNKRTIICHQVNCQGVMGAGIALQIRRMFPNVYYTYKDHCKCEKPKDLLGSCLIVKSSSNIEIANLFGQFDCGFGRQTDYEALEKSLKELKYMLENQHYTNFEVRIPYNIGCGIAGGDWNIVKPIIENVFYNVEYTVEIWKL